MSLWEIGVGGGVAKGVASVVEVYVQVVVIVPLFLCKQIIRMAPWEGGSIVLSGFAGPSEAVTELAGDVGL